MYRSISTKMDAEIKEENTLVISFGDKNRTGVPNPYRPSYGTNGKPVEFWTNYFPVILPCELTLYRYNITIDDRYDEEEKKLPEPKSNKLKQIVRILLISLETLKPKVHIATDFKSTLVCSGEIPQKSWHPNIVYVHEDDKTPGNHPQRYQLHIEEKQPPLKVSELKKFLGSAEMVAQYEHRDSMLQALNILLGHHAKSTPTTTMVGGNRAYTRDQATERSSLQGGVEAVRGYFLSVRLASFRTLVNVNVSHGAFYEATGLPDLITKWVNHNKLDMKSESEWTRLETLLKGVKMRTNYLKDNSGKHITQVRSVKGFASQRDGGGQSLHPHVEVFAAPPYQVWFHLNDVRDFSRQKWKLKDENRAIRDKYISVDEFFESSISTCGFVTYLALMSSRTHCNLQSEGDVPSDQLWIKGRP